MEFCQWHIVHVSQLEISVQVGNKSPVFSHYEDYINTKLNLLNIRTTYCTYFIISNNFIWAQHSEEFYKLFFGVAL